MAAMLLMNSKPSFADQRSDYLREEDLDMSTKATIRRTPLPGETVHLHSAGQPLRRGRYARRAIRGLGGVVLALALAAGLLVVPSYVASQTLPTAQAAQHSITLNGVKGSTWYQGYKTVIWGKATVSKPTQRWVKVEQKKAGGKYKKIKTVRVTSGKSWNWKADITIPAAGKYQYRVRLLASKNGKTLKTSAATSVTVRKPIRVHSAITTGSDLQWFFYDAGDNDGKWDVLLRSDRCEAWWDTDKDPNNPATLRMNAHIYNVRGDCSILEYLTYDTNYDGYPDLWLYDTDDACNTPGWGCMDQWAYASDGQWVQAGLLVNSPQAQPLGMLRDLGIAGVHLGNSPTPCAFVVCIGPGL